MGKSSKSTIASRMKAARKEAQTVMEADDNKPSVQALKNLSTWSFLLVTGDALLVIVSILLLIEAIVDDSIALTIAGIIILLVSIGEVFFQRRIIQVQLTSIRSDSRDRVNELQKELRRTVAQQRKLDKEAKKKNAQVEQLEAHIDTLEARLNVQKQQNQAKDERLRTINDKHQRHVDALQNALKDEKARNGELEQIAEEEMARSDEARREADEARQKAEEAKQEAEHAIEKAKQEVKDAQNERNLIQAHNDRLSDTVKSLMADQREQGNRNKPLLQWGSEQEIFGGEIRDYVLEAVSHEYNAAKVDTTVQHRRKSDVLGDILRANPYEALHETRRKTIKNMASRFSEPDSRLVTDMGTLGFLKIRGDKHHVFEYGGDSRYTFTMAKTPSDYKEGDNMAEEINRRTQ